MTSNHALAPSRLPFSDLEDYRWAPPLRSLAGLDLNRIPAMAATQIPFTLSPIDSSYPSNQIRVCDLLFLFLYIFDIFFGFFFSEYHLIHCSLAKTKNFGKIKFLYKQMRDSMMSLFFILSNNLNALSDEIDSLKTLIVDDNLR